MNHKRKRPKSTRAGCLFCKPHKHQGNNKHNELDNAQVRKAYLAGVAIREAIG